MKKIQPKRKKQLISIGIFLVLIVGYLGYMLVTKQGFQFDDSAEDGTLEGLTEKQLQDLMNKKIEEGMLSISISSSVEFEDGKSEGEMRIENVPDNRYNMIVKIVRNDNQQVIYESKGIKPGQLIKKDKLDVDLDKGKYSCTANFSAYDPDTNDKVGQANAEVVIYVKN